MTPCIIRPPGGRNLHKAITRLITSEECDIVPSRKVGARHQDSDRQTFQNPSVMILSVCISI